MCTLTMVAGLTQHITVNPIVGYDCASPAVNITSYSLNTVKPCLISSTDVQTKTVKILVLQKAEKIKTTVIQCKLVIERSIRHCGMHSHTSDVKNSYAYMARNMAEPECKDALHTGRLHLYNEHHLSELKANQTQRGEKLVVGHIDSSHRCVGGLYSTTEGTWSDVLVHYKYTILLNTYTANVYVESDTIHLRNGLNCDFSSGSCLDSEEGFSFWDTQPKTGCEQKEFETIYHGEANKTTLSSASLTQMDPIYTTTSGSIAFTIRSKAETFACNYRVYTTDHNRVFVAEVNNDYHPFINRVADGNNLDLLTYFNSKFTLLERHTAQEMSSLYANLLNNICKLDKQLMTTNTILARLNPQEFASQLTGKPGYTAVVSGEVIHVLKCEAVVVTPHPQTRCYQEFPVLHNGVLKFRAPVTHILQRKGTEIECAPILEAKYQVGQHWVTVDQKIRDAAAPEILGTQLSGDWSYKSFEKIISSGLYDSSSIDKMKNMIYESSDRRSVSNVIDKTIMGSSPDTQGFDVSQLFSKVDIESKIRSTLVNIFDWAKIVANLASSAFGFYIIAKGIKFLLDTMFHCRILYDIYGFSWKLIGSFWDSVTAWLEHKDRTSGIKLEKKINEELQTENIPLQAPLSQDNDPTPPYNPNMDMDTEQGLYPSITHQLSTGAYPKMDRSRRHKRF